MTVCYLILAHKYPELFKKIAQHILNSGGVCVAHIDKKADIDDFYVEGVSYVRERENVRWAGYSAVKATQKMLAQALKEYPEATHYASITGQCYPVRPLREYADYLARPENLEHSWVSFYALAPGMRNYVLVLYREYKDFEGLLPEGIIRRGVHKVCYKISRLFPRKNLPIQFYQGSAYWTVSRSTALQVMDFLKTPTGREVTKIFRSAPMPDEMWMQSILLNIPARENAEAWETDGQLAPGTKHSENHANHHYIDWSGNGAHPEVLTEKDLPVILESGKWFTRKVEPQASAQLIDALDAIQHG